MVEGVAPIVVLPLDLGFRPAVLSNQAFVKAVQVTGAGVPLVLGLERAGGAFSRYETTVFPSDHPAAAANLWYAERLVKFLLWQRGGWRIVVGGPSPIGAYISKQYSTQGPRAFDVNLMGEKVYGKLFTVQACTAQEVEPAREIQKPLGRHLTGCRIGFDLGASDRKVSAVVDGEAVFSEEVVWEPRRQSDPEYHYQEVVSALKKAVSKMPRLDAIGGSSAGIYIDNRAMHASLFRGIPEDRYDEIRQMFLRIREEFGVPLEIVNDGEVTALAGSMALEDGAVLGIALGSSEAGGYVTSAGNITDWLNELAFCPVDYQPEGPVDEWSGDKGVGAQYFSQQAVFRLAPRAGIELPADGTDAAKLKSVQEKLEARHDGAQKIWETMGCYLGYGIAHYAHFYELRHVLILGRCTSGRGGGILVEWAKKVLQRQFPELASSIEIHLPDEKIRRVGQAIAAASLPCIKEVPDV